MATIKDINEKYPKRNGYYFISDDKGEHKFPSITKIIDVISKPYLIPWAAKKCIDIALDNPTLNTDDVYTIHRNRDVIAAGTRGTGVHNMAFELIKDINYQYLPVYKEYADPIIRFLSEFKPEIIWREKVLVSFKYGIGGTADYLMRINGLEYLIDIKTSPKVYTSHGLQLDFYDHAKEEVEGRKADKLCVLHLPGDGTFDLKEVKGDMDVVMAMKKIYNWIKGEE